MKQHVIFDFDGTLVDSLAIIWEVLSGDLFKKEIQQSGLTLEQFRQMTLPETMKAVGINPWRLALIANKTRRKLKDPDIFSRVKLVPGMKETVSSLAERGVKLWILSSNDKELIRSFLSAHRMEPFFLGIASEPAILGKGRALRRFMKAHKILRAEEVCYVGDEVRDVEAARAAGIDAISVSWGFQQKERLALSAPDFLCETPQELLSSLLLTPLQEASRETLEPSLDASKSL